MAALSLIVDEASPTVTYVGEAAIGTPETAPNWRIKKLEQVGSQLKIKFAEGSSNWNAVWNDRSSLTYI